jgi:hypothetical protein
MTFHRSPSGLTNLHLFIGTDVVIFVEGGQQSFTLDEVIDGSYSHSSVDLKFWQGMFSIFLRDGRKCQFRAIGSKPTLKSIAGLIINNQVFNVWVAMDRDHDYFHGELHIAPGILYTHGYSWENDVCNPEVIEEVFWTLVQIARGSVPVREEIEGLFAQISSQLRRAVYLDILIGFHGASLLPRDKPDSVYKLIGQHGKPSVNREYLSGLIGQLRKAYPRPIIRPVAINLHVARDCVGKIIACFYCRVLQFLVKQYTNIGSIQKQIISNLMIEKFITYMNLHRDGNIYAHYAGQFAMISSGADSQTRSFVKPKGFIQKLYFFLSRTKRIRHRKRDV